MSRPRQSPYATPDARTRRAKAQGYPARSIYKLEEIDRRLHLLAPGQHLLDLGAAPGSWSLYAAQRVGARGAIVAVDLQEYPQAFPPQVLALQGDAFELREEQFPGKAPFDGILSDMAPRTTGNKISDQARSHELFLRALEAATLWGKQGSFFVAKLFMGPDFQVARSAVAAAYGEVRVMKPEGTRPNSVELFVIGMRKKAAPAPLPVVTPC